MSNTELMLTLVWWLILTLASSVGLTLMLVSLKTLLQVMNQALYLTTIPSTLVFLVALSGLLRPLFFLTPPTRRKPEGNLGWLRGLSACISLLTGLVLGSIIVGDLSVPTSFTSYLVLLTMAVTDRISVGRNQFLLS